MNTDRTERGQVIVLILLVLVVMLGFTGLAVDGGHMFSELKRAQNAADASAYAAALAAVEGKNPYQAALKQAALNDYADSDRNENPDLEFDVVVNNPPVQGAYAGNNEYFEVLIHGAVEGTFSQLFMIRELPVEAYAVTRARTSTTVTVGNAVHSLNSKGNGIEFKGDISVDVTGGNIFSNSAIDKDGGSGDIHVNGGGILYVLGDTSKWNGDISPAPEKAPAPVFVPKVPDPDCGTTYQAVPRSDQGKKVYSPGIYASRLVINAHDDVVFEPGMYCFLDGIHDNGNSTVRGFGVTFILKGGDLQFNGNSTVNLVRPNSLVDASGNQWGGMLLYTPSSNADAVIDITGNNETSFTGTVLAPKGYCRIGGNSQDLGVNANVICEDILFHGTPNVIISYETNKNYRFAPSIELTE
jgi:Flp pilus assembly protein TadG